LVRKAGGAVKTLELDVGLGDFVAPMSTVPELVGRRSP